MKNKGLIITLIVLLSIITISLITLMVLLITNKVEIPGLNFGYKTSNKLIMDETYEETFDKIDIESTAGDISIYKSNNKTTRVVVYSNKDTINIKTEDNELYIKSTDEKCVGICFNTTINKIEVYIPEEYSKNITINNKFGDISIDEFKNADIEVNEDCGDVTIESGNNIIVNNSYGDIEIKEGKSISIKESAGDVKIDDVEDVKVENKYGDIKIKNITNYFDLNEDCGDIKINSISINKDSSIKNSLGDIEIGETNEIYIDAKTSLGNVKIKNNFNKSDITLKIKNDCGDIKINN